MTTEVKELEVKFSDGGMTDTYYMQGNVLCKGLYDKPEEVAIAYSNKGIKDAIIEDLLQTDYTKEVVSIKFINGEVLI